VSVSRTVSVSKAQLAQRLDGLATRCRCTARQVTTPVSNTTMDTPQPFDTVSVSRTVSVSSRTSSTAGWIGWPMPLHSAPGNHILYLRVTFLGVPFETTTDSVLTHPRVHPKPLDTVSVSIAQPTSSTDRLACHCRCTARQVTFLAKPVSKQTTYLTQPRVQTEPFRYRVEFTRTQRLDGLAGLCCRTARQVTFLSAAARTLHTVASSGEWSESGSRAARGALTHTRVWRERV